MSNAFLITGHPDLTGPLEVSLFESGGRTLATVAWNNGIKVIVKTAAQAREIAEAFNEAAINLDFNERRIADAAAQLAPTASPVNPVIAVCGTQHASGGWVCTIGKGHTGPHIASQNGTVLARWPLDSALNVQDVHMECVDTAIEVPETERAAEVKRIGQLHADGLITSLECAEMVDKVLGEHA
jgi:hypothetical protein